jgi:predicted ATP-grasp superfamily ATP-dependent carboligase
MARVLVYEYFCSRADQPGAGSLRTEGWAMLAAVLGDFARCPGVEIVTLLEPGLVIAARAQAPGLVVHLARPEEEATFRAVARECASALVIAPECDDLLFERCRWAEEEGVRLLGPSSDAVALTGDKLRLAEYLRRQGVPTPPAVSFTTTPPWPFPLVVKPRHGAGSQATFLVRNQSDLVHIPRQARAEGWLGELIVQPWLAGRAASVALLGRSPLLPGEQVLSADGRFHYQGGRFPLAEQDATLRTRAESLACRAAAAVPGLEGYYGIDLILAQTPEQDAVIEINPRLMTSYIGLRAMTPSNLASALLAGVGEGIAWQTRGLSFTPDGRVIPE